MTHLQLGSISFDSCYTVACSNIRVVACFTSRSKSTFWLIPYPYMKFQILPELKIKVQYLYLITFWSRFHLPIHWHLSFFLLIIDLFHVHLAARFPNSYVHSDFHQVQVAFAYMCSEDGLFPPSLDLYILFSISSNILAYKIR